MGRCGTAEVRLGMGAPGVVVDEGVGVGVGVDLEGVSSGFFSVDMGTAGGVSGGGLDLFEHKTKKIKATVFMSRATN